MLQTLTGIALAAAAWAVPRRVARSPLRSSKALALDLATPLVFFVVFAAVTARPVFAGAVTFGLLGGFAFTDWIKRETLREPAVFSDIGELIELFRHPRLYLPFAGPGRVLAGAAAAFGAFIVLLVLEPPAWPWTVWVAIPAPAAVFGAAWIIHGPGLRRSARLLRAFRPSGDPFEDASTLGPLAMQWTYSLIARDERSARRSVANGRAPALTGGSTPGRPMFVVQCESFFDARRLHPSIPASLTPFFADACRVGVQYGSLTVPGWGANTMRAEFAVMTGIDDEALGFDRFNPYFAFARAPVASLARRMQAQGYRTICLHPFDRTFYRRDQVMRHMGFDAFLGEEAFAGAKRIGGYVADFEVARLMLDMLHEEGPNLFLFAITMENHGPWNAGTTPGTAIPGFPASTETAALARYLAGVKNGDDMLGILTNGLKAGAGPSLCAFYGDHLPGLPKVFEACKFTDVSSDYVIWRSDGGPGLRRDLSAHDLSQAIFDAQNGMVLPARVAQA